MKKKHCREQHGESVSIRRVRQLRNQIRNEAMQQPAKQATALKQKHRPKRRKRLKKSHAIF